MGIFDSLKRAAESALKKEASKAVNNAVNNAAKTVGKGKTALRPSPLLLFLQTYPNFRHFPRHLLIQHSRLRP